jgi:hypothetical protein
MAENQIVQIRKKGGLDHIQVDKAGRIRPEIYYQQYKDPDGDGIPQGVYREGMILDAKHFISPHWDDMKKRWPWGSTNEKLVELISKMKLKYGDDHKRAGEIIKPGDAEDRLTNFYDDVFRHKEFYGTKYLQDSRGSFNFRDPKEEFLHYCYKGSTFTVDKSEDKLVSKYAAGAKYELVSPKAESKRKVKSALKDVESKKFIGMLYSDDAKIRAICEAMDLANYRPRVDTEAAWLLLDEVSQNTTKTSKYGGKTQQEMFLECCNMKDEELALLQKVVLAKKRGHLRKWTNYFTFDGDKIHVKDHNGLVRYFKDPKNQEQLIKLIDLLESDGN